MSVEDKEIKTIVNLTPQAISIYKSKAPLVLDCVVPPNGAVARCNELRFYSGCLISSALGTATPTTVVEFGEVTGLPEPIEGIVFIVSKMVADALYDTRPDLYFPGELVRNGQGEIIGCIGLSQAKTLKPQFI